MKSRRELLKKSWPAWNGITWPELERARNLVWRFWLAGAVYPDDRADLEDAARELAKLLRTEPRLRKAPWRSEYGRKMLITRDAALRVSGAN